MNHFQDWEAVLEDLEILRLNFRERCTGGALHAKDVKPMGEDSIFPSSKTVKTRNHFINCSISLEAKRLINRKAKRDRKREEKDKLKENPKTIEEDEGEG